jgi:hypothetical protein
MINLPWTVLVRQASHFYVYVVWGVVANAPQVIVPQVVAASSIFPF